MGYDAARRNQWISLDQKTDTVNRTVTCPFSTLSVTLTSCVKAEEIDDAVKASVARAAWKGSLTKRGCSV